MLVLALVANSIEDSEVVVTVPASTTPTRFTVKLVETFARHKARLGFQAPREVIIHRKTVQEKVDAGLSLEDAKAVKS
jgi:hypothetical protein